MQDVRNAVGKLVCRADGKSHRVEIVRKGQLTVVSFGRNGSVRVTNASKLSSNLSRYHRSPGLVPAISKRRYRE